MLIVLYLLTAHKSQNSVASRNEVLAIQRKLQSVTQTHTTGRRCQFFLVVVLFCLSCVCCPGFLAMRAVDGSPCDAVGRDNGGGSLPLAIVLQELAKQPVLLCLVQRLPHCAQPTSGLRTKLPCPFRTRRTVRRQCHGHC